MEGGAAVCDEKLRGGREEEERGRVSLPPSLFLTQSELQCDVHVTVGANEMIFPYLYLKRLQVMLSS